jgi:putative membrane protein
MTPKAASMKFGLFAIALGGSALIALVAWFGGQAIGREVLEAGWAIPATLALHLVQLYLSAIAWRIAIGLRLPRMKVYFRLRWIREAVNSLLPVAQMGGNIVGMRMLTQRGVPASIAAAGTTLDLTIEALTQFAWTMIGIATLAAISSDTSWRPWVEGGAITMGAGLAGFVLAQRAGLMRLIEGLARQIQKVFPSLSIDVLRGLHAELMRLQSDRRALAQAFAIHLTAWMLGTFEVWLALTAMEIPVTWAEAVSIESLGMAARSAGFVVPGALGVQETGFILVCSLFQIPADTAIALSMVKRVRELGVGIPGLVAWQWSEGKRLLRQGK